MISADILEVSRSGLQLDARAPFYTDLFQLTGRLDLTRTKDEP